MVSIIIPMFNAEKYICACVKSIEEQVYKNIEIIIVNDGSTDNSYLICQELCRKYDNINLINVPNGGVSKARNIGLSYAKGDYIQFVDADDKVDKNYTSIMLRQLKHEDADLIVTAYRECGSDTSMTVGYRSTEFFYKDDIFSELIKTNRLLNSPCNKLYKKELISFEFPEYLELGEDLVFNLSYAEQCKKMYFINTPLYNYITRAVSLTTKYNDKKFENIIQLDQICCSKYGLQEIYVNNLIDNIYDLFCIWAKTGIFKNNEEKKLMDLLCNSDYLISRISARPYQGSIKKRIFVFLVKKKARGILLLVGMLISLKK